MSWCWKEGGEYRIAMHIAGGAAIAGLGGGNVAAGAGGAGVSAAAAGYLNDVSNAVKNASPTGNADADRALGNIIANVIATGAGAVVGGSSGASAASSVDLYNDQNHRDKPDARPGHENAAGNDVNDNHLNILPTAGGAISKDAQPETFTLKGGAVGSPTINPVDIAGKTPQEIGSLATEMGLLPKGPNPQNGQGAYVDPAIGQQRVLIHPGEPCPHCHVNDSSGARLDINGTPVAPESPAAHLSLKK